MREPTSPVSTSTSASQQALIQEALSAGRAAAESLVHLVPALDPDRAEYAVASTLLAGEAWVSAR